MTRDEVVIVLKDMLERINATLELVIVKLDKDPEPKWRPAEWPRDAANPPKEARFLDQPDHDWKISRLIGRSPAFWVCDKYNIWLDCEVRDE